ncbi:MAG: GyrI-like domain-containing protein [Candidatus Kapaibacterium sp.]
MKEIEKDEMQIIGLELETKTSNMNGKSGIDISKHWEKFEKEQIYSKIPNKVNYEIVAVYFDYDGDYTEPFSYMIGCEVTDGTEAPYGMRKITIPKSKYRKFLARGKMPDCVTAVWKLIWGTDLERAYTCDFEVYGEKSQNWEDAEVEVFIAVK